ncbi:putative RNA-binding protein [Glycine max]|nr:putative RNA-binding protein [Glycine max]KAH1234771.1 putative RNA-binding protein [Glycine max]
MPSNKDLDSEMGTKVKKAMKNLKRATTNKPSEDADFLSLEGGPVCKQPEQKLLKNTATVLYVGRIPHGFYEKEMEGYIGQFRTIKKLRIARNKRERTLEEHMKLVEKIMKHDKNRRKRIEAAGVDYECPEIVVNIQPAPKKMKFED